jgi:hypothetical protein
MRTFRNVNQFHIKKISFVFRPPFNSTGSFPNQAQWNSSSDGDFHMASVGGDQTPKISNNQKTSERFSEDESKLKCYFFMKFQILLTF